MKSPLRSVVVVLLACLALAGCGRSDSAKVASTGGGTTTSTGEASSTSDATGTGTASSASVGPGSTVRSGGGTATTARPGTTPTTSLPPATTTTRPAPAGASGVRGVVTAGPQCPVQREGDHSCDDKPVPAHLSLQRADGTTAASADAGADGQFFIAAGAGDYTLVATSPNAMRCASQPVAVTSGHVTDVRVSCDTGIR